MTTQTAQLTSYRKEPTTDELKAKLTHTTRKKNNLKSQLKSLTKSHMLNVRLKDEYKDAAKRYYDEAITLREEVKALRSELAVKKGGFFSSWF